MIITEKKTKDELQNSLKDYQILFLVGCGECATTCKTGGESQLKEAASWLEACGKKICGVCIPAAPCIAAQIKTELAKNAKALKEAQAILVFACGLGVQSVKDNLRGQAAVLPALDSVCGAVMDKSGNFVEKCSTCGQCVLDYTETICPITLCPKGLLNGPCGGVNKGKCEVDRNKDCAWVLIYNELEKKKKTDSLKIIRQAKDFKRSAKPHKITA
jgi:hypothetical protein